MVVGGEKRLRPHLLLLIQVLGDGPCYGESVERARPPPDLVEEYQAASRGAVEYVRQLGHLDHERGLPAGEIVERADTGEYPVYETHPGLHGGDEGARLRHDDYVRYLTQIGRLACHVRAREYD